MLLSTSTTTSTHIRIKPTYTVYVLVATVLVHSVLFLPFHAAVLEPDLDLSFSELDKLGDLDATPCSQIAVEMKLFLKLESLTAGVRCS